MNLYQSRVELYLLLLVVVFLNKNIATVAYGDQLTHIGPTEVTSKTIGKVTASRLNLRAAAHKPSTVLATLKRGTILLLYPSRSRRWYRASVMLDGRFVKGWIWKDYVKLLGPAKASPTRPIAPIDCDPSVDCPEPEGSEFSPEEIE